MTAAQPSPPDVLIDLLGILLTPMFLVTSNGDVALARLAAFQTMNAYRIQHQADLLAVAQIVAFGLATLSSLSLSMDEELSLSMVLRLRGNANACNRSAEQNRRALKASHQAATSPTAPPATASASRALQAQSPVNTTPMNTAPVNTAPANTAPTPVAKPSASEAPWTTDQQRRAAWAAAFTQVAEECAAELPHLSPDERKLASIRVDALNSSASALLASSDETTFGPHWPGSAVASQGV